MRSLLKDDRFVVYSPNDFNSLGLGTTQLYGKLIVFNRKRSGCFEIDGREYYFYRWREAPKQATKEFLLVEMLNRIKELAEDRDRFLEVLKWKINQFDKRKLQYAINHYGTKSTQRKFKKIFMETKIRYPKINGAKEAQKAFKKILNTKPSKELIRVINENNRLIEEEDRIEKETVLKK
jgi:hypothetical protein